MLHLWQIPVIRVLPASDHYCTTVVNFRPILKDFKIFSCNYTRQYCHLILNGVFVKAYRICVSTELSVAHAIYVLKRILSDVLEILAV